MQTIKINQPKLFFGNIIEDPQACLHGSPANVTNCLRVFLYSGIGKNCQIKQNGIIG